MQRFSMALHALFILKVSKVMKSGKYIGIAVLALVWVWLVVIILLRTSVTLLTIIWIAISAIIIFVPLYKRYFKKPDE